VDLSRKQEINQLFTPNPDETVCLTGEEQKMKSPFPVKPERGHVYGPVEPINQNN
jgi:hypothetical protein